MMIRFNLHVVKSVSVNTSRKTVTFETHYVNALTHYFTMTRDQFLAFDDALCMIDRGNMQGDFPLGYNMWFTYCCNYNHYEIELQKDGRLFFKFDYDSFIDYKRVIHQKLLSFFRLSDEGSRRNGRRARRSYRCHEERIKSTIGECSLPDEYQSSYQSTEAGISCERQAISGTTNYAVVSNKDEASAILSEWGNSINGRKDNSASTEGVVFDSLQSPERIQLIDFTPSNNMDML